MIWSPLAYREAAVVAYDVAEELLLRLEWLTVKPQVIVDMGCGTGEITERLQTRYPNALVVGFDSAFEMCDYAREQQSFLPREQGQNITYIQSEVNYLPLQDQTVDLIFANFCFPWCDNPQSLMKEWRRILSPGGVILLTAFGPDTLKEWQSILSGTILPFFMDMHDLGDLLLQTAFSYPVVEVDYYTVTYRKLNNLYQELFDIGMLTAPLQPKSNNQSLMHEQSWAVTWEIIFAHAFASDEVSVKPTSDGIVKIPVDSLRLSRTKS